MKKRILFLLLLTFVLSAVVVQAATTDPMLKSRVGWSYGKTGDFLNGHIPALDETVVRPWELFQWKAIFHQSDGTANTINNYDVFNVKKKIDDPNFDKENGLGLVHKSKLGLGDLFDAVMTGQKVNAKQLSYFRESFVSNAEDPIFKAGHPFFYTVDGAKFLRISGILPRMGVIFDRTEKVSESDHRAHFNGSKWPELKVSTDGKLNINFTAYGYTERNIRIIATPKGSFPDLSLVMNLNDNKLINTSVDAYDGSLKVGYNDIVKMLGKEVDIILDDGYGRTAIKSVTLPEEPEKMDFVPTKLTLTEGGQLWLKFRYDGDDFNRSEFANARGIPNTADVKIGGAVTAEFTMPGMFNELPATIKNGQEFSSLLGKIEVGDKPGKYYIKVTALVNNPNHPDRALETPAKSYLNNEVNGEWVIDIAGPQNDLIAQSVTVSPSSMTEGEKGTISAKVKNIGSTNQNNVLIRFYDNQKQIYEVRKNMPANEVISVGGFSWTGSQIGVHSISVHVDPEREVPDKDRTNNIAVTGCSVSGSSGGSSGKNCSKTNVDNNWTVTYRLITGYHTKTGTTTWTDSAGKSHSSTYTYTDYSDPIWESRNVGYSESLDIIAAVNTKQGIVTDNKRPKTSDRESRGSWAIIPWSAKNGLDPNKVTRAGYGFEIKVTTKYETNWEKKVPVGLEGTAKPFGGKYVGPSPGEVVAKIYNSKGNFVETLTLERTSGGDTGTAVWELPKKLHRFQDGQEALERKYYTNKDWSDGDVTVQIVVTDSGSQGNIEGCSSQKVRIYGSMYEDSQNIRIK
ncbi:CARDB domain-containing protein [Paenibacillus macquariensis]|uniref:CARDB protein n=1 Tax=Paenibacillus macquariensis TaxID=948756 RepID=A0ABY1KEH2_9BACL|nr:CARDB domain-containing protein [Paenibacillus macquariensis]OAB30510.1 hypothetical protein PMSM_22725 [Paenibacillus macquariensis subsp. macquariensis]SIR71136.1 CARDB protein [Paenibacillus macquariensis]